MSGVREVAWRLANPTDIDDVTGEVQVRWPAQVADLVFEAIGGRGGWAQILLSDHYGLVERLTRGES